MDMTFYSTAGKDQQAEFREWMKGMLRKNAVSVTFRKQNGDERVMNCTLQEGIAIPHIKTTDRIKEVDVEVCPVWDIDKSAWRSFKYESVLKVSIG